jgi:hypothetical protein
MHLTDNRFIGEAGKNMNLPGRRGCAGGKRRENDKRAVTGAGALGCVAGRTEDCILKGNPAEVGLLLVFLPQGTQVEGPRILAK